MNVRFLVLLFLLVSCSEKKIHGGNPKCLFYWDKILKENVYTNFDTKPEFLGGDIAFLKFMNNNLKIDEDELHFGSINMEIIIDIEGKILQIEFLKEIPESLEQKVKTIISQSKNWKPGICSNQLVVSKFIVKYRW